MYRLDKMALGSNRMALMMAERIVEVIKGTTCDVAQLARDPGFIGFIL